MKNLLLLALLAGAALLGLALLWFLRSDGGRRSSPLPQALPAPEREAEPAAPIETQRIAAPEVDIGAPSARTATELPARGTERRLAGTVLFQGGATAVARVAVYARGEPLSDTSTSASGAFSLTFPVPSQAVLLRIEAEGFASLERDLGDQLQAGELGLGTLWLRTGVAVQGLVLDGAGTAVEGADVRLTLRRPLPSEFVVGDRTTSGPDGRFAFPSAPAGLVVVTARAAGLGEASAEVQSGTGQDVELRLEPERTLLVRVVGTDGAPIAGIDVELRNPDALFPPRKRATDAEGHARFDSLGAPSWNVLTVARGYRPAALEDAPADGSEIRLELVPWPSITGTLVAPGGAPLPAEARVLAVPRVAAMRGDIFPRRAAGEPVGAGGAFRLLDLRAGEYVVRADAPGFAPTLSAPVAVSDSGEAAIGELVLQRGGSLELVLVVRGAPVAGVSAEIHATAPIENQLYTPRTPAETSASASDVEGRLVLAGLAPGSLWLVLRGPDTVPELAGPFSITNEVASGPIHVELRRGLRLHGRVLAANGQPLPRARLRVLGVVTVPLLEADEAGNFASLPVPPGSYTLEAFPVPGGPTKTSTLVVRLAADEDREIEFRLPE